MNRITAWSLALLIITCSALLGTVHILRVRIERLEAAARRPLDINAPTLMRWEGQPSEVMPLWEAMRTVDANAANKDVELRSAIESDLHKHDATFHLTHEEIDGRTW
ncbi:MAG: hypothetical protein WC700_14220 [Gemmatimonadaceae bacterium]